MKITKEQVLILTKNEDFWEYFQYVKDSIEKLPEYTHNGIITLIEHAYVSGRLKEQENWLNKIMQLVES